MEKIKNNFGLITYFIIIVILTIVMFWAISKKEGFHEDEMFSYGASNSTLGNTFLSYGRIDNIDSIIKRRNPFITLKNYVYYKVLNKDAYNEAEKALNRDDFKSIWRTREDAIEYLQIDNFEEAIDIVSVYWNTAKDVHPPLFYFAVHIVSILFWGHFSKYIIFIINLTFFIGTVYLLRKILFLIDRKNLAIPNLILYGASIGAISTVMFQRMYMMLTYWTIWLLYINLKIFYNNFILDKKLKRELITITILGFLTQYNFCVYAVFLALIMVCIGLSKNQKKAVLIYFGQYVKAGIIGVLIFLPSIYHIFFSYRGAGRGERSFTIFEAIKGFCKNVFGAYSLSLKVGAILSIVLLILFIWRFVKSKSKEIYIILVIPTFFTFLAMCILSPYKSLRYIMFILPIISIIFVILVDEFMENKKFSSIMLTILAIFISTYGIVAKPINYLYLGYQDYIDIAKKYENDRFVLVMPTVFSQIQDMKEFQIYKESLIISPDKLEDLKEFKEFEQEDEFIVGIKNWLETPAKEVIKDVAQNTGFKNYELIYDSDKSAKMAVFRLYK